MSSPLAERTRMPLGSAAEDKAGFGCPVLALLLLPVGEAGPSLPVVEALLMSTGRPACPFYRPLQELGICSHHLAIASTFSLDLAWKRNIDIVLDAQPVLQGDELQLSDTVSEAQFNTQIMSDLGAVPAANCQRIMVRIYHIIHRMSSLPAWHLVHKLVG